MAKVLIVDKFVEWQLEHENEVIALITSHLVQKAILKETTDWSMIERLIRYKYNTFLSIPEIDEIATTDEIFHRFHDCLIKISQWEVKHVRPPLSSLVLRMKGTEAGLPHFSFWKTNGIAGKKSEKELLTKRFHKQVFAYYDIGKDN